MQLRCRSDAALPAQIWLRCGSDAAQMRLRCGSDAAQMRHAALPAQVSSDAAQMRRCFAYHTRLRLFAWRLCRAVKPPETSFNKYWYGLVDSDARAATQKQLGWRKVSRSHVAHPSASGGATGEFMRWLALFRTPKASISDSRTSWNGKLPGGSSALALAIEMASHPGGTKSRQVTRRLR
jgi:hypothetical protein